MIFDSRSGKIKTKITGSKWFERKEDIKQMRLPQIINSLLETDMYKFSMGQTIFHQFTSYKTTWTFKCRNKDVHFTDEMVEEIKEQVQAFCQLRFTEEELEYLDNITWIKGTYVDFLRLTAAKIRGVYHHNRCTVWAGNRCSRHVAQYFDV